MARSLETKWETIKHDVLKFHGIYQNVKDSNVSGRSEEDIIHESLALYELIHPKRGDFAFEHCWQIFKGGATLGGALKRLGDDTQIFQEKALRRCSRCH